MPETKPDLSFQMVFVMLALILVIEKLTGKKEKEIKSILKRYRNKSLVIGIALFQ